MLNIIHVNARVLIVQVEPEYYELPGDRIEEYESITDAIKREVNVH